MKLEDLQPQTVVEGVVTNQAVTVVAVHWYGSEAVELTYKESNGHVGQVLLYRSDEQRLRMVEAGRPWAFDGDGALFRLVSEAQRIRLAYLFDPLLAVHTSLLDPLPHQITAVYEAMLPRQPLRFLDVKGCVSGAKTITVTGDDVLTTLNKPDAFILAIVGFLDDGGHRVHYIRQPFQREPDFGVTSMDYDIQKLLARAEGPG